MKVRDSGWVWEWVLVWTQKWVCLDAGLALLRIREAIVRDPYGALSTWNDKDEHVDHCSWFGVECSDGKVVIL